MKGIALTATLLLGGCAASGPATTPIPLTAVPPADAGTLIAAATDVREVDLQSLPKEEPKTVCRKEAPTGSRIAVMRCTPERSAAQQELDEYLLEKDLEYMRAQALYEERMRQAREAAIRQRQQ